MYPPVSHKPKFLKKEETQSKGGEYRFLGHKRPYQNSEGRRDQSADDEKIIHSQEEEEEQLIEGD